MSIVGSAGGLSKRVPSSAGVAGNASQERRGGRIEPFDALVDHKENPVRSQLGRTAGRLDADPLAEADLHRGVVSEGWDDVHGSGFLVQGVD